MKLYIDPGTGSMLFTVLLGVIGAVVYSLRMLIIRLRFKASGKVQVDKDKLDIVVFSDDKRYWSVFEPVCRELSCRGKEVVYITASKDDPALECGFEGFRAQCIENKSKLFARLNFLNVRIVLSTTPGLDVYQWKRSKDVECYVHIPHAANDITLYRMFGLDYYDSILLSGEYQVEDIRALEEIRSLPEKELVKVGIPYMDEMARRLEGESCDVHKEKDYVPTVLLAPSWGKSAILSVYGDKIIDELINTGYRVIIRPHPQSFESEKELMQRLMDKYPESDTLKWNRDRDNFEVLRTADVMISDFSGVVFDFSLVHEKPVIYTNPDFNVDVYDAWWLKKPLWTASALPKIGCELKEENMSKLKELIDDCMVNPRFAFGRSEVKSQTWENCGKGAVAVSDYLVAKCEELKKTEEGE